MDDDLEIEKVSRWSGDSPALFVFAAVGFGALFAFIAWSIDAEVEGQIDGSDWVLVPDRCSSGQLQGFHGVELGDGGARTILVIKDPTEGPKVVLVQGASRDVFDAAACEKLEIELHRGNTIVNEVHEVVGRASFTCDAVSGDITFAGCTD